MARSTPTLALALALAVIASGCQADAADPSPLSSRDSVASSEVVEDRTGDRRDASDEHHDDAHDHDHTQSGTDEPSAPAREQAAEGPTPATSGTESPAAKFPSHSDFLLAASVEPGCVVAGGEITIEIDAGEKAGVGYLAVYAGEEYGAPPPYGHGHGGNDGDMTDDDGRYQSTWRVSPGAPVGDARVEVMAARRDGRSTTVVPFVVADPTTGCN